ncbi:MAG TPA: RHS repeat-associated core domain-containing protein [Bryobacteraceae bacterium]
MLSHSENSRQGVELELSCHVLTATDSRQIPTSYVYDTYEDASLRAVTCSDKDQTNDHALVSVIDYDQLGRVRLTRQMETPSCVSADDDTTGIKVQTRYAPGNGVDYTLVSNPFREATSSAAASNATMGWTLTTRDADGRIIGTQSFDGSGLPGPWGSNASNLGIVTTSYDGKNTTVMDQMGNIRQTEADGLGRLTSVLEDPGASPHLNYLTTYTYDVSGNLTSTTQDSQARSFSYDSLSRLSQATNPESGAITYDYDEDGNLTNRKDARDGIATFTYDALNRMKQKSYANTLASIVYTPTVNYTYDQAGANSIGHLTQVEAVGVSTTAYGGFDVLGRPGQSTQNTANNNFVIQYAYNLTGAITSETYPSGRVVATSYDGANRIQSITGTTAQNPTPAQYTGTTAIAYAPQGAIQTLTRGDGLTESWSYNNRLQPASVSVGSGSNPRSAFGLDLYYCPAKVAGCATNNGNLATASLSILGVDQNFTYDGVDRVLTAAEVGAAGTAWTQTYGYDRYGNRRVSGGIVLDPFTPTVTTNFNANNQLQIQNSGYDPAGNLTHIGGYGFAWDAENRMVASAIGNVRTDYSYDGEGRRVMKQSDTGTTIFVYDVSGHLAAEYSTGANSPTCMTCYLSADQLGSTRVVTDQNGAVVARHDYLPFGEEIPQQYSGRTAALHFGATENIAQKFTGKERDAETGMDYFGARYYSGRQGRFTSPDEYTWVGTTDVFTGEPVGQLNPLPYADINNPQSLNKYTYVLNNPLRYTDPDGHCVSGTVDTLICAAAGVAIAKIVTDLMKWRDNLDETQTYAEYYNSLLERAITVCSTASPECQAALDAAERARLAALKKGAKTAKAAITLPGTFVAGPLPTSRDDLAVSTIQDLLTAPLEKAEDKAQQKNQKTQNGEPNAGDPIKPHKPCLQDRDGNCIH